MHSSTSFLIAVAVLFASLLFVCDVNADVSFKSFVDEESDSDAAVGEATTNNSTGMTPERLAVINGQIFSSKNVANNVLEKVLNKMRERSLQQKRLKKCVEMVGSQELCQGKSGQFFYMWAQLLAKDIMEGKFDNE